MYKNKIIVTLFYIIILKIYFVNARNYYCEAINDETLCNNLASTGCQWCNKKWGCMTVKDNIDGKEYECPTDCISNEECYSPQNITEPIFYSYYYLQTSSNKTFNLVKEKNKKNTENFYSCSENCLKAIVSDWKMFTLIDNENVNNSKGSKAEGEKSSSSSSSNNSTTIVIVVVLFLLSAVLSFLFIYQRKSLKKDREIKSLYKNNLNSNSSKINIIMSRNYSNTSNNKSINNSINNSINSSINNSINNSINHSNVMRYNPMNNNKIITENSFRKDIDNRADINSSYVMSVNSHSHNSINTANMNNNSIIYNHCNSSAMYSQTQSNTAVNNTSSILTNMNNGNEIVNEYDISMVSQNSSYSANAAAAVTSLKDNENQLRNINYGHQILPGGRSTRNGINSNSYSYDARSENSSNRKILNNPVRISSNKSLGEIVVPTSQTTKSNYSNSNYSQSQSQSQSHGHGHGHHGHNQNINIINNRNNSSNDINQNSQIYNNNNNNNNNNKNHSQNHRNHNNNTNNNNNNIDNSNYNNNKANTSFNYNPNSKPPVPYSTTNTYHQSNGIYINNNAGKKYINNSSNISMNSVNSNKALNTNQKANSRSSLLNANTNLNRNTSNSGSSQNSKPKKTVAHSQRSVSLSNDVSTKINVNKQMMSSPQQFSSSYEMEIDNENNGTTDISLQNQNRKNIKDTEIDVNDFINDYANENDDSMNVNIDGGNQGNKRYHKEKRKDSENENDRDNVEKDITYSSQAKMHNDTRNSNDINSNNGKPIIEKANYMSVIQKHDSKDTSQTLVAKPTVLSISTDSITTTTNSTLNSTYYSLNAESSSLSMSQDEYNEKTTYDDDCGMTVKEVNINNNNNNNRNRNNNNNDNKENNICNNSNNENNNGNNNGNDNESIDTTTTTTPKVKARINKDENYRNTRQIRGLSRSISDCVHDERRKSRISSFYQNSNNTIQSIPNAMNMKMNNMNNDSYEYEENVISYSNLSQLVYNSYNSNLNNSNSNINFNYNYNYNNQNQNQNANNNGNMNSYGNAMTAAKSNMQNNLFIKNGSYVISPVNDNRKNSSSNRNDMSFFNNPKRNTSNSNQSQPQLQSQSLYSYPQDFGSLSSISNQSMEYTKQQHQDNSLLINSSDSLSNHHNNKRSSSINKTKRHLRSNSKINPITKIKRISYNSQLKRNEIWLKLWNVDDKEILEKNAQKNKSKIFKV